MVRPRKRFGQHFLEPAWVTKLVAAIAPQPTDRFIEIGPGRGAITAPLAARVERLIAVEVDRDLAAALEARGLANVTVITADVLEVDLVGIAERLGPASASSRGDAFSAMSVIFPCLPGRPGPAAWGQAPVHTPGACPR